MAFDWQAMNQDEFLYWALPSILSGISEADLERFSEATNKFTNVEIGMTINGIPADGERFLIRLNETMEDRIKKEAARIVAEHTRLTQVEEIVESIMTTAKEAINDDLRAIGIESRREEW